MEIRKVLSEYIIPEISDMILDYAFYKGDPKHPRNNFTLVDLDIAPINIHNIESELPSTNILSYSYASINIFK